MLLTACTTSAFKSGLYDDLPHQALQYNVPYVKQDRYQCGPATLEMVLRWSGQQVDREQLTRQVYSPKLEGSLQPMLLASARRHQRLSYTIRGWPALLAELAVGHPVIVFVNLGLSWLPQWHYMVVLGYNRDQQWLKLHNGPYAYDELSWQRFEHLWKRGNYWGLVVLSPERLPTTRHVSKLINAAVGLEKASNNDAAISVYQNILHQWPENWIAAIGISNLYYEKKAYDKAIQYLNAAVIQYPENAIIQNNLAQVLLDNGEFDLAFWHSQVAYRIDGGKTEAINETFEKLKTMIQK